ncbi:hypothetical protein Ancab_018554 [Ancistrocladus abbreviatus]
MRRAKMASTASDQALGFEIGKESDQNGDVIEEIQGLIRVYKDGRVERPPIMQCVAASLLAPSLSVHAQDIVIDRLKGVWARFYVPKCHSMDKLPLLLYFHGGGFCIGSVAWKCYHDFLEGLSARATCLIVSVNYRLAPEYRLPAAYEDGIETLWWMKQQVLSATSEGWSRNCNMSNIFLAGDSAGANIAYNVALRMGSHKGTCNNNKALKPLNVKGIVLIQPFFGGEIRTNSEKHMMQSTKSALNLEVSDTYWRMALPKGANRDHAWCNPLSTKLGRSLGVGSIMVCISEMDILKDRSLEFCRALARAGNKVKHVIYKGVGHAFQVLDMSQLSQARTHEMISHIQAFIS